MKAMIPCLLIYSLSLLLGLVGCSNMPASSSSTTNTTTREESVSHSYGGGYGHGY